MRPPSTPTPPWPKSSTRRPASGAVGAGAGASTGDGASMGAGTSDWCSPMVGARKRKPMRSPSSAKQAVDAPARSGRARCRRRRNVLRETKCSLTRTSAGFNIGVATMPRRCASAAASSIVIVEKNSSNMGLSTSMFCMRAKVCCPHRIARTPRANPSTCHIAFHWRGARSTSRMQPSLVRRSAGRAAALPLRSAFVCHAVR